MKSVEVKEWIGRFAAGIGQQIEAYTRSSRSGSTNAPYKTGRYDKPSRKHNPQPSSGDRAVLDSHPLMTNRTRDLYINSPLFKRATDVVKDLTIGCGIQSYADPIDYSFGWNLKSRDHSELIQAFNYGLESDEKFMRWATDPKQVDVEGKSNLFDMQQLLLSENCIVGASLLVWRSKRGGESPVPFQLQLIEREQIDVHRDTYDSPTEGSIVGGFQFDGQGREVGVYIYDEHPHGPYQSGGYRSTFVPANRYWHLYKKTRPSQNLGASWLHAGAQPMVDRDNFLLSELRSAVKQALFALVIKTMDGSGEGFDFNVPEGPMPGTAGDGNRELSLGTNPIAVPLLKEEELDLVESSRPNPTANNFYDLIDHDIASAFNLSYYSMTGRFEKTNYGGFRGAMNLETSQIQTIQEWLSSKIVRPIRKRWNELAFATDQFDTVPVAQYTKEKSRFSRFDCIGPGRFLLDSDKETTGDLNEIRGGLSTLKIKCARRGHHWLNVLRQVSLENMVADELNIALDHSSGGGGSMGRNTRSQIEDAVEAAMSQMEAAA